MAAGVDDLHSVVVFHLNGRALAVSTREVREVVPNAWLAEPPRMPAFVRGVLNLGGVAVPVLCLDRLLGLPEGRYGLGASILIMKAAAGLVGLLADRVEGVQPLARFQCLALEPENSLQGCVVGQLQGATGTVALLSWEKVLLREEQSRLEEFRLVAEARLANLAEGAP